MNLLLTRSQTCSCSAADAEVGKSGSPNERQNLEPNLFAYANKPLPSPSDAPFKIAKHVRGACASADDSKAAWLAFRGLNMVSKRIGDLLQLSPMSPAFRTIAFTLRSPVILSFDKREHYCPCDEEVFEDDSDDDI